MAGGGGGGALLTSAPLHHSTVLVFVAADVLWGKIGGGWVRSSQLVVFTPI